MVSLAEILNHAGKRWPLRELPKDYLKLNKTEETILRARLDGISFSQMDVLSGRVATDKIILQGAAISGCPLPQTEGFAEIIAAELLSFLTGYGYDEYTLAEVIAALRLNVQGEWKWPSGDSIERIDFTGHCFNVGYVAKILNIYSVIRRNLDRRFQNKIDGHE